MRRFGLIVAASSLMGTMPAEARQAPPDILTSMTVVSVADSSPLVVAGPRFKGPAGVVMTMSLGASKPEDAGWLQLQVMSEPKDGKILVHVIANAGSNSAKFDVFAGPGVLTPVLPLRTDAGVWLADKEGRRMFVQIQAEAIPR